jgi:hypothetical protein
MNPSSPPSMAVYHANDVDDSVGQQTTTRNEDDMTPSVSALQTVDTVSLGSLTVPQVGLGTISWSADTGT